MKRFTLFIALLLCLTITGVYATWMYAGVESDVADVQHIMQVALEDYDFDGASGTFYISSNLGLKIDQDTTKTDHSAKLVYFSLNDQPLYMEVKFVPNVNANKDIKDFAIDTELYFATSTDLLVKVDADGHLDPVDGTAVEIFKFSNKSNGTFEPNIHKLPYTGSDWTWTPGTDSNGDACFTCSFDEEDLKNMIQLNTKLPNGDEFGAFKLDTKADYDAFNNVLLSGKILSKVSDGFVNNNEGG